MTKREAEALIKKHGDEVGAAIALAKLGGDTSDPAWVHLNLVALRKALGKRAPSYDGLRVELRKRGIAK